MTRKSLFPSYSIRGYYTLEPLAYDVHHTGVNMVVIVEDPLAKYVGRDRSHGTRFINL